MHKHLYLHTSSDTDTDTDTDTSSDTGSDTSSGTGTDRQRNLIISYLIYPLYPHLTTLSLNVTHPLSTLNTTLNTLSQPLNLSTLLTSLPLSQYTPLPLIPSIH